MLKRTRPRIDGSRKREFDRSLWILANVVAACNCRIVMNAGVIPIGVYSEAKGHAQEVS